MIVKRLVVPFETKGVPNEEGVFSGYGSVFGNTDRNGDVVERGAFTKTLADWASKGKMPAMFWQHDQSMPIGTWTGMVEDSKGLRVEGKLALKTIEGANAYQHMLAGTVQGLSIGYITPKGGGEWDSKAAAYRLKAVNLWEVSPIAIPANEEAGVEEIKSAIETPREFERFLRDAGLSRSQAKGLMSRGYEALRDLREADDELTEATQAARNLLATIKGR